MVDDADEAYAIMGDDMVIKRDVAAGSASPRRFALLIALECVDFGQLVGSLVLDICQPPGYPRTLVRSAAVDPVLARPGARPCWNKSSPRASCLGLSNLESARAVLAIHARCDKRA